jgi:tetratricopeptide (TPR) repeat protein
MSFRKISYFIALSWAMSNAAPAWAQTPTPTPDPASAEGKRAEGKARYERGVEAYSAGRFKDAIDLFLQADALAPSAALSFNIARACEKIGDDAASLQWYRDFRRRAPDAKNGADVDARIHSLEAVLAKKGVQQLTIMSTPSGATVIVDEQPVGVTPYTGQLPPGVHKLVLTLKGYSDVEQKLELAADHAQDVSVPLVVAPEPTAAPDAAAPLGGSVGTTSAPANEHVGPRFGIWPWVGLGAGAVSLGGALGFELARRSAEKAAKNDSTQVGYKNKLDREQSRQTTSRVLAAVGGALVVTGGTLLVIDLTSRSRHTEKAAQLGFGFMCLPGACALDARGQF